MKTATRVKVLVLDDDRSLCLSLRDYLEGLGYEVQLAHSGQEALQVCRWFLPAVMLVDQRLPDTQGASLCASLVEASERAKVIFITAYPSFENALKAIDAGAFCYLSKPFELQELKLALERCARFSELEQVEEAVAWQHSKDREALSLVGRSQTAESLVRMIEDAAASDVPVLITGETGTGKSLVAKNIHYRARRPGNFVNVICSALPDSLVESELFGYERGAFTGAQSTKKGLLEVAHQGTLFLDEIGEATALLQSKLLGVLDESVVRRVGGTASRPVDLRLVAASNAHLEARVEERSFRKDLYYRLNVIRIHLPPLRERTEDLRDLVDHFLSRRSAQHRWRAAEEELRSLVRYPWPGNVRELRNVVERAIVVSRGEEVRLSAVLSGTSCTRPAALAQAHAPSLTLAQMEKNHIQAQWEAHQRNWTKTARALGISVSTLRRKMSLYELDSRSVLA